MKHTILDKKCSLTVMNTAFNTLLALAGKKSAPVSFDGPR